MTDRDYENFVARMGSFEDSLSIDDNEELTHYGILGMKWGKRKAQGDTTTSTKKSKKGDDEPTERRMSNKELNARIKRLRLEAEFERLSPKPETKSLLDTVAKTVGTVATLTTAAMTIYTNVNKAAEIAKPVGKAINKARAAAVIAKQLNKYAKGV